MLSFFRRYLYNIWLCLAFYFYYNFLRFSSAFCSSFFLSWSGNSFMYSLSLVVFSFKVFSWSNLSFMSSSPFILAYLNFKAFYSSDYLDKAFSFWILSFKRAFSLRYLSFRTYYCYKFSLFSP